MITLFKDPFFRGFDTKSYQSTPETNVEKNELGYKVSISVPGLTKEDLKICTKEGMLNISYEKEDEENQNHFINSFVKSYRIPEDVKEKDIEGKVEYGVLTISLPIDKRKSLERTISLN